jgi:hypothetical protein
MIKLAQSEGEGEADGTTDDDEEALDGLHGLARTAVPAQSRPAKVTNVVRMVAWCHAAIEKERLSQMMKGKLYNFRSIRKMAADKKKTSRLKKGKNW